MIQILIPTYNRDKYIRKNLKLLINQIKKDGLENKISILISNNCSSDNTCTYLDEIISTTDIKVILHNQKENIGLEKNAIWLLSHAKADFIIFLGDDDYLPDNYLNYLFELINNNSDLTCVLPGLNGLLSDGSIIPSRIEQFEEKLYQPSFRTLCKLSHIGHQMSGVLLKRDKLYEKYTSHDNLRNIYPFIFFVSYCISTGQTIYVPKYKVHVSIENTKNWKYDDSGLLTEIFKNFKILFYNNYLKRNILNIVFIYKQTWRLRVEEGWTESSKALKHLMGFRKTEIFTKFGAVALFVYLYTRKLINKTIRK